jgi:hypothetical protein
MAVVGASAAVVEALETKATTLKAATTSETKAAATDSTAEKTMKCWKKKRRWRTTSRKSS